MEEGSCLVSATAVTLGLGKRKPDYYNPLLSSGEPGLDLQANPLRAQRAPFYRALTAQENRAHAAGSRCSQESVAGRQGRGQHGGRYLTRCSGD